MNYRIQFLTFLLFFTLISCQQSASNDTNNESTKVEVEEESTTAPTTKAEEPKPLSKLEQLDFENNKTITESGEEITKAIVDKGGGIFLYPDNIKDHRIFAYESPDLNSTRLLLISAFTNDVEGNPFQCELGAFYDSEEIEITYLEKSGDFVKAQATANGKTKVIYVEKKWLTFEQ
jgi:hypothetical protein